ncbi:MAG: UDP-N-acetylglucosamine--N-acetylmuramyl-(pentapeptide) pyrophosphoryl-undecaprenol N-acetylglucosamine transferase [Cryobacterium sp.]|uniref:UDP-N-acetylglucosamine--N-acetylmuramyl- (pentapeptide) pyrophosphoryl-undecaprenol N-acetylglucosamine transferase n=1 Tax=unclassified Cryobacterium TaxID=2649013 RepID=UPI0018CA02CF|nr:MULTISPECIES: UDP-N-acetylglucosamine--N-acetylmuramyl-(pentapeptide) pyrophosphoryl-undecaprenol N-acetylglucosamine transferase [unclassified Cryobacterium]MCY7404427.1 UDP-N-acetylglucosamine--N-acetylmuramyl-(pentapeptide) pyrophosphoryl-undecaprenol N-acetylglucosamine transferase [Cryobacterium sp.]MEC5153933.1 UDP-N-acetylglucosamine--N-acetylmuramyl-(pentapeptide) pyrophosphoryl-undecaprenol N-acetylglucosamine transferase [Cryobacterium sp. CAN_C3]
MTTYLLAGGGTAGHVNPLLALADRIRATEADATVLVLGTAEGLEARLVPARGYELIVVPRVPFPRRANLAALRFLPRFTAAARAVSDIIRSRHVDVVVGFGGYVSTPAYLAARRAGVPIVIHEANAKPGLANKLGARLTRHVGVAFAGTPIRHARFVGMPLRPEIEQLDRAAARPEALAFFALLPDRPVLLVTGGSLGARRLNATMVAAAPALIAAGWQVLHITGSAAEVTDPELPHYHLVVYCDRMDLALAAADVAVTRAGAATVSELCALGIPAVYVPYPVGNGEQRFNAAPVLAAGGGLLIDDTDFVPAWVQGELVTLLGDRARLEVMAWGAASVGALDGTARMLDLVHEALAS